MALQAVSTHFALDPHIALDPHFALDPKGTQRAKRNTAHSASSLTSPSLQHLKTKKTEALASVFEHPHADSNRGSMTENHMS